KAKAKYAYEYGFQIRAENACNYCRKSNANKRAAYPNCRVLVFARSDRKRNTALRCTNMIHRGEKTTWDLGAPMLYESYFSTLQKVLFLLGVEVASMTTPLLSI